MTLEHSTTSVDPARAARLEALREELEHRIDALVNAGSRKLDDVTEGFESSWKELNELLETTRH